MFMMSLPDYNFFLILAAIVVATYLFNKLIKKRK